MTPPEESIKVDSKYSSKEVLLIEIWLRQCHTLFLN